MSLRTHRIKKIIYDDSAMCINSSSKLFEAILSYPDTNDMRNQDGGGIVETPFKNLLDIEENHDFYELSTNDILSLHTEIQQLRRNKTDESEYILYDMF